MLKPFTSLYLLSLFACRIVNYSGNFLSQLISAKFGALIAEVSEGLKNVEKSCFRIPERHMTFRTFFLVFPTLTSCVEFFTGNPCVSRLNFVESKTREVYQQHTTNQSRLPESLCLSSKPRWIPTSSETVKLVSFLHRIHICFPFESC